MRFFCLLPVRDEADIIGQCIRQLLTWSDGIYVFDTGSIDDSWEIVNEIAAYESRVIPLKKDSVFFSETKLRGWMFHQARQHMSHGDWFLRVDADEFHHISPPEFVKTRLRPHETIVYHQYYNFVLRESEIREWEAGRETIADRSKPIEQRRQWYDISLYAEPRLCRYRSSMKWPPNVSFPHNAGFVARERLPIRHYPHRDPAQLERRCRLRAVMMADRENRSNWSQPELHHWAQQEWRKFVTADGAAGLKYWAPGCPLEEVRQFNHVAPPIKRGVQRLAHALLLPILDSLRPSWSEDAYPQLISDEVIAQLQTELSVSGSTPDCEP
jgi:hypothetical protein